MRRRILTALALLVAVHLYIWWRLIAPLPGPWFAVGTVVIAVLGPSFPLTLIWGRRMSREKARPWLLVGFMWFGLGTYLFLGAMLSHVAVGFGASARDAAAVSAIGAIAAVVGGLIQVSRGPLVRRTQIRLAQLSVPSYTVVQLTDVHIGPLLGKAFAEELVRRVNAVKPDLIVITGDLVDGNLSELRPHIEPLRGLRARDGVYSVTGNHEYYWNPEPWLEHIKSLGIKLLRNEHVTIANAFELAGVDDSTQGEDVPRAVAGRRPELPLLLLAHHPRTVQRALAARVDLQLSGHTHGGQLLPLGWLARLFDPVVSGLKRFGDTQVYVSEGTGFWGPPMRVGTRCEIAVLELVPAR